MNGEYTLSETMYMISKEPTATGMRFYREGPTAIFFSTPRKGHDYIDNAGLDERHGLAVDAGWDRILDVCRYLKECGIRYIGIDPETQKFLALPIDTFTRDVADMVRWDKANFARSDN